MAYKNLVKANQLTAQELLPKKKHLKRSVNANAKCKRSQAKGKVFEDYEKDPSRDNQERLQLEKGNLKEMYDKAFEKKKKVEEADLIAQHALS